MKPVGAFTAYVDIRCRDVSNYSLRRYMTRQLQIVSLSHIFGLAVIGLFPRLLGGTMVIAVSTAKAVYIGADSRTDSVIAPTACKLVESHGIAVGLSGQLVDAATGFDARKLVLEGMSRHLRDLKSTIDSIK